MKRAKVWLLLCVTVVLGLTAVACKDRTEPAPPPEPTQPVIAVTVSGTEQMYVGDTAVLTVTATEDGAPIDATLSIKSGNDVVSLDGVTVTALKSGTAVITATAKDKTAEFTIRVSDLVDLRTDKKEYRLRTFDLHTDNTVSIAVTGIKNGVAMTQEELAAIAWSTSDNATATAAAGVVTFKKAGTVGVTATYGQASVSVNVTCVDYAQYTQIGSLEALQEAAAAFTAIDGSPYVEGAKYYLGKYVLTQDIDLENTVIDSTTLFAGNFLGIFDGNGHKLYNFTVKGGWTGVFAHIGGDNTPAGQDGLLANLTVECKEFTPGTKSSVLAQTAWGKGVIDNCFVHVDSIRMPATPNVSGNNAANGVGLTAINVYNGGTVRNCVETGVWTEGDSAEGFRRIGYKQNDKATYENNVSIIANIPDNSTVSDADNILAVDYESDVSLYVNGKAALEQPTDLRFVFASRDEEIATVTDNEVTGVSKGVAVITATADGISANGRTACIEIKVRVIAGAPAPVGITYNGTDVAWDAVADAVEYMVSVSKNGGTAEESERLAVTTCDIADMLDGAGIYTVRVKSIDANGQSDGYSEAFIVTAVSTKEQLAAVDNDKAGNYLLTADIDLGGATDFDIATGSFTGVFDGNGHKIYNFNVSEGWQGLFYNLGGAKNASGAIRNVTAHCKSFTTNSKNAILVAAVWGSGALVENCTVIADEMHLTAKLASNRANGTGLLAVTLLDNGLIRNCTEIGVWASGENANALTRIAFAQGAQKFENNTSVYFNVPAGAFNSDAKNNIVVDYAQPAVKLSEDGTTQLAVLTGRTVTFKSQNDAIATVSPAGLVTAVAAGKTNVEVTVEDVPYTFVVPVTVAGTLTAPTNVAFYGSVVSWDAVDQATTYRLTVAFDGQSQSFTTAETQYDIKSMLTQEGAYTITVKAVSDDISGEESAELVLNGIKTAAAFKAIKNAPDKRYIFVGDVDLNNEVFRGQGNASVINELTGIIDGNGYALKNYIMENSWSAFITRVSGTIRNMDVLVTKYVTHAATAVFVDHLSATGKLENIRISVSSVIGNSISGSSNCAGLAVARRYAGCTLKNVTVAAVWTGVDSSGNNSDGNTFVFGKRVNDGDYTMVGCSAVLVNAPEAITKDSAATYVTYTQQAVTVAESGNVTINTEIASGYTLEFETADASIATIDAEGTVTGVKVGDTTVTVKIMQADETILTFSVPVTVTAAG